MLVFFRDEMGMPNWDRWKAINLVVQVSGYNWLLIGLGLLIVWITKSSYRVFKKMSLRNIELSKVDRSDLERMLNGRFCFGRFLFSNDGFFCGRFKGMDELDELRETFVEIKVAAPKFSIAHLRLSFMTPRNEQGLISFFFRDQEGNPQLIESIYTEIDVPVNAQGKIALKFVCRADYLLDDSTSLDVWAHGWTK